MIQKGKISTWPIWLQTPLSKFTLIVQTKLVLFYFLLFLSLFLFPVSHCLFLSLANATGEIECIYWDDALEDWSQVGCQKGNDSNGFFCECTHLTSFSIGSVSISYNFVDPSNVTRSSLPPFSQITTTTAKLTKPLFFMIIFADFSLWPTFNHSRGHHRIGLNNWTFLSLCHLFWTCHLLWSTWSD